LAALDEKRAELQEYITRLKSRRDSIIDATDYSVQEFEIKVINESPEKIKIALFRSLFRGREDVFPKRFESKRTQKSGYQPVCHNEWIKPFCKKPKTKCGECDNRQFVPVSDDIIRNHLIGVDPNERYQREFVIGIYPMLIDETCWFLAVDFDKDSWMDDAITYLDTCQAFHVPASLERSRSGNGGHVWIFFSEPIPAKSARQLGAFMLTQAMEARPDMGFDSYDRFFPSQDTIPKGGFGNLIALPLQKKARESGNSVFVDDNFNVFPDQWAFLTSIQRMNLYEVRSIIDKAALKGGVLGVRFVSPDEDEIAPWMYSPSGKKPEIKIEDSLPDKVNLVLGNQIYINKEGLPPALKNRLIRLAAFQNPEFYKAQAMRFPTYDKPRIVHCCEDFPKHIGLPRGCLEDVTDLLNSLGVQTTISDERFDGVHFPIDFKGVLRPDQQAAVGEMLKHDTGVLSASTAFGKTVIAAYMIAKRSINTLVLVHRKQLLDQWIVRLKNFLDVEENLIGQIGAGKRNPSGLIDVAMIQSLNKKGVVDDLVADYGHLVVDECHHVSARSFEIVARRSKAKYITGLSATVIRKDGHHPIIFMNCGPIRYKIDDKKQSAKRPFSHKLIIRKTKFKLKPSIAASGYSAIHDIYESLTINAERNKMIVNDIVSVTSKNRFPVILTERKEHLEILRNLLENKIEHLIVMKGGMGKKQRAAAINALEQIPNDAKKAILATGRYLGEGFDDNRLDTLFLTLPISWRGTLAQYAGRLHRMHDTKNEVQIFDYVDLEVPMLAKMYKRRITGYRAIGYEIPDNTDQIM